MMANSADDMEKTNPPETESPAAIRKKITSTNIDAYNEHIEMVRNSVEAENLRSSTSRNYVSYLKIFAGWLVYIGNPVSFLEVMVETVRIFSQFLLHELALSAVTVNGYLAAIRKMFHVCRDEELSKRVLPDLVVDVVTPKVPGQQDVTKMLKGCVNVQELLIIGIPATTGVRFSELLYLRYRDILRDTEQIWIESSKGRTDGYVPLRPWILERLEKYCQEYMICHPGCSLRADDYIFCDVDPTSPMKNYKLRKIYWKIQERAGLREQHFTPHSLRHYYGLNMYLESHDIVLVKNLLRHKTLAATLRYLVMAASIEAPKKYTNPGDKAFENM